MGLKGKKVLVTGASRGIGRAIAITLAAKGASIAIHYHQHKEQALEVLAEIKSFDVDGEIFQADFNNPEEAQQLGKDVWDQMNGIDFLVNNAGVSYKKHFLDSDIHDIDFFTNVNYKSTLLLTQTIASRMVAEKVEGSIYTITSINAIQPGVGLSIYGASKGALETLMKGVALELAPHNIRVNTIAAGAIETDMNEAILKDAEKMSLINQNIPMGRMGKVEEVASLIVGLMESDSYMTGATITVDGGWLLKTGFAKPGLYINKEPVSK